MKILFSLIFIVIFAFCGELRIATYNVENLFDGVNNGNEYRDFRIGKGKWNEQKALLKLKRIQSVLQAINADIIALQEVENEQILKELARNSEYKFATFAGSKNAPVGLGLLSKIRPKDSERFVVNGVKTRDILRVGFELDGKNFDVFVVHFPAYKRNGYEAQKKAERTLQVALGDRKNAIALGDFNTPFSKGKSSLLHDIMATKNYTNLWQELPYKQRYSFAVYGKKRAIDHVLLTPNFMSAKGDFVYVCGSFNVFKDGLVDVQGFTLRDGDGSLNSDHLPLVFKISTDLKEGCGIIEKIFR